ncbi:MAG TPA: hypothetical protein PLN19_02870 [Methanothrix sp.]|nr:hypothetical protein [Methanothrix sp.]HQI68379.1 hypothetical protein [Methanothrix sp.]HRS85514.1 hypothetical protein [Methanothrix sp.]HRT16887.1 hypothetical protein [Methanothrix sp.]
MSLNPMGARWTPMRKLSEKPPGEAEEEVRELYKSSTCYDAGC